MKYLEMLLLEGSSVVTVNYYAGQEELSSDDLRIAARQFDALAVAMEVQEVKRRAQEVAQAMKKTKELNVEELVKEIEDEVKIALG